jgi:RNA polymerase sigma-70 factor, ECF subfamily
VVSALVQVTEEQRALLILHDMEGVTAPELAAEYNVPLNTMYTRVRAAREAFRTALTEDAT